MMMYISEIIEMINVALDTKRKRHAIGGTLLSLSALFAGLAITSLTIKEDDNEKN